MGTTLKGIQKMTQLKCPLLVLSFMMLLMACGGVKLIDIPRSTSALNLSAEQRKIIEPKIAFIDDIVEDYDFERSELKVAYQRYRSNASLPRLSRYEGGGRTATRQILRKQGELRLRIRSFVKQRQDYAKEIAILVEEIRAHLSPEQLGLFAEIELPKLELPEIVRHRSYNNFMFVPGTRMANPDDF